MKKSFAMFLLFIFSFFLSPAAFSQLKNVEAPADSLDLSYEIKLLQLQADMAKEEAARTDLLHSLIPHIAISVRIGQRSLLFIDPTSPITYPTDALGAVLSFDIDKIINRIAHKEALIKVKEAKIEIEKRKSELLYEVSLVKSEITLIDSMISQLQRKRIYKQKLVEQYELRFNEAKAEYDQLIRAKLDLAETELEISKLTSRQTELKLRLKFKLCSHSLN
ncbi:MAG: TolC family protein [Candidatus Kryptoniota bacterium]